MSQWTVATLYKRFIEVIEAEYGMDYDTLDLDNITLADADTKIRDRIVTDATK